MTEERAQTVADIARGLGLTLDPWQEHMLAAAFAAGRVSPTRPARPITRHRSPQRHDEAQRYLVNWIVDEVPGPAMADWQIVRVLANAARLVEQNKLVQQQWEEAFREFRHTSDYEAWAEWQALATQPRQPRDFSAELAAHDELRPCVDLVDGYRFGVRELIQL